MVSVAKPTGNQFACLFCELSCINSNFIKTRVLKLTLDSGIGFRYVDSKNWFSVLKVIQGSWHRGYLLVWIIDIVWDTDHTKKHDIIQTDSDYMI